MITLLIFTRPFQWYQIHVGLTYTFQSLQKLFEGSKLSFVIIATAIKGDITVFVISFQILSFTTFQKS